MEYQLFMKCPPQDTTLSKSRVLWCQRLCLPTPLLEVHNAPSRVLKTRTYTAYFIMSSPTYLRMVCTFKAIPNIPQNWCSEDQCGEVPKLICCFCSSCCYCFSFSKLPINWWLRCLLNKKAYVWMSRQCKVTLKVSKHVLSISKLSGSKQFSSGPWTTPRSSSIIH